MVPIPLFPIWAGFLELGQLSLLCLREFWCDSAIGLRHHVAHFGSSLSANFLQFFARPIEDGGDFLHLCRRQVELPLKAMAHFFGQQIGMSSEIGSPMTRLMKPEEDPRRATRQKRQDEAGNQFPFERSVHGLKAPEMAESAIAY
ncbi:hypothetical protein BH20VER3_BH20VER3_12600 [soil metagenome]